MGEACQKFSEIYRRARGLFIGFKDRDRIDAILDNTYLPETKVITYVALRPDALVDEVEVEMA